MTETVIDDADSVSADGGTVSAGGAGGADAGSVSPRNVNQSKSGLVLRLHNRDTWGAFPS